MAATTSKKSKKKKGQTLNLTEFLGTVSAPDGKTVVTVKSQSSWADEVEDEDNGYSGPTEHIALPSAPRAARQEIDLSQLPDKPPFTVYVGNLSYDVDEESLAEFFTKMKLAVSSSRLARENDRMKGYGYVDFLDKGSLIEAMKMDGEFFMSRKIKVDLSTAQTNRDGFGGRDGKENNQITGEGDADDDWRGSAAASQSSYEPAYGNQSFS